MTCATSWLVSDRFNGCECTIWLHAVRTLKESTAIPLGDGGSNNNSPINLSNFASDCQQISRQPYVMSLSYTKHLDTPYTTPMRKLFT